MFKPINITLDHGRLGASVRSRMTENASPTVGWGAVNDIGGKNQTACRVTFDAEGYSFDSGWIETDAMLFNGEKVCLPEGVPVRLSVTLRDDAGNVSETAYETVYNAAVSWEAPWIGGEENEPADRARPIYLRREFTPKKPVKRAVLYACGLGYMQLSLNGERTDTAELDPAHTDYNKTCQYVVYPELAEKLNEGANCLGAIIGAGWRYNCFINHGWRQSNFMGPLIFSAMLKLTYADGSRETVLTGSDWQRGLGGYIYCDIFNGTEYDAAQTASGFDTAGFKGFSANAVIRQPAGGVMRPMLLAPIVEHSARKPIAMWPLGDSVILDFGQNLAGVCRLRIPAGLAAGSRIELKHAEELDEDGSLYTAPLRSARAADTYIAAGDCRDLDIWQPVFTYHGFRYVQLTGLGSYIDRDAIEAVELHTDLETYSSFRCGDPLINAIHAACVATERANQHSILTDCPQRDERMGWMNDATVRFEETPYNFDIGRMFPKLIRDIFDTQNEKGGITCTAPLVFGSQPADPVCSSFLVAGMQSLLHCGNLEIIAEAFPHYEAWENCLLANSDGYIVNYSHYGDWAGPAYACEGGAEADGARSAVTPGIFMSTGFSYLNCKLLSAMAGLLDLPEAETKWASTAETVKAAMLEKWYDPAEARMCTGSHACQVFSLWLGIIPENDIPRAAKLLRDDLAANDYRFTTGNLCTRYLMDVLCDTGYLSDAWALIRKQTYPSFGFMLQQEATTIWERFELKKAPGMNSHSHPMYGAVDYWFYAYLGGIKPVEPGWSRFTVNPYMPEGLLSAQAVVDTVRGEVSVRWMKRYGKTCLHLTVPFGSVADVTFAGETYTVSSGFHVFEA